MSRQRGQAIIGVMVIMLLIFVLAGAVAIGTSTLLTRLRGPATDVGSDLTVRSAAAAAAALSSARWCSVPQPPGLSLVNPTSFSYQLPASNGRGSSTRPGSCVAVSKASATLRHTPVSVFPAGACTTTVLDSMPDNTIWWFFFTARWGTSGVAYVASATDTCQSATLPKDTQCSLRIPTAAPGAAPRIISLALSCAISGLSKGAALFVSGVRGSFPAYAAQQDTAAGGSYYLGAAGTGLSRPDFEQVLTFEPAGSSSTVLRFEGALP